MTASSSALIGSSGFVGSSLRAQTEFDALFRSTNIAEIAGRAFDTVVCAGAPAKKWLANRDPQADRRNLEGLIDRLATVRCDRFILISTVDVFGRPLEVDEGSAVDETGLHPYGLHRRRLEAFVQRRFADHLVVRLPGLVGGGLRKNVLYDLLHENALHAIDSRSIYQFYPVANLWRDIQTSLGAGLRLVHLAAEPISVARVAALGFGRTLTQTLAAPPARYDLRTRHAAAFGGEGPYQYHARESIAAIRAYARSAPAAGEADPGAAA